MRFRSQFAKRLNDLEISGIEGFAFGEKKLHVAALLNRDRSIAVELNLILPVLTAWQRLNRFAVPSVQQKQLARHFLHHQKYRGFYVFCVR